MAAGLPLGCCAREAWAAGVVWKEAACVREKGAALAATDRCLLDCSRCAEALLAFALCEMCWQPAAARWKIELGAPAGRQMRSVDAIVELISASCHLGWQLGMVCEWMLWVVSELFSLRFRSYLGTGSMVCLA